MSLLSEPFLPGGICFWNSMGKVRILFMCVFRQKYERSYLLRHTFSVYSFKQMIDSGLDMYVALPILSAYLGHKSIAATEKYVRLTMGIFPYIEEKFRDKLEMVFEGANYENH